jgi:putative NADPH-quinone reductase
MRVLVLYAHPVETSFDASLHRQTVEALHSRGHEVDDCDLYAEGFDPVLHREERIAYRDAAVNRAPVASYVDRLLAANALILVFPVWNFGFPAILKGFLDRVLLPGVSFEVSPDGAAKPKLENIARIAAVCTYGADRLTAMLMGDPPRRIVKRSLRALPGRRIGCDYLAHYDMNHTTPERRAGFMSKVKRRFEAWGR